MHLTDALKVILGGNYVKADSESVSYSSPMNYSESKFSPYAGITYNFTPEYTGYMSYTSISAHKRPSMKALVKLPIQLMGKAMTLHRTLRFKPMVTTLPMKSISIALTMDKLSMVNLPSTRLL